MKQIDEYEVGDTVILNMTGMIVMFIGQCVSTKQEPTEGTPGYDHPRFEIIGMIEDGERMEAPYQGTILKPGDYIIMEEFNA